MVHDAEKLMAYVDGELAPADRAAFEAEIVRDPALAAAAAAEHRLRERIGGHYAPVADEPVPERLRAMLESGDAQVVDFAAARARRDGRRRPRWMEFGAIAATLAVGVIAGQIAGGRDAGPVAVDGGVMIASAALDDALDTQLASAQPADAAIRIGLTFRDHGGQLCRSFDAPALAGIACRSGDRWQLRRTVSDGSGTRRTEYRQASSAAVMAAAQEMMRGPPLDAAAERAARDSHWR